MTLDTNKWLHKQIVNVKSVPPKGVYRIDSANNLKREYVPALRFFPEDIFKRYALNLNWTQEKLDLDVKKGKLIPAMVDVWIGRSVYIKSGFMFSEQAKKEYKKFLGQVARAYDFSEVF